MDAFVDSGLTARYVKSLEQAWATSVYEAVSNELEGTGGLYLKAI